VTASVGIAQYPAEAEDEQSLLQNADFAMYLAKKAGRNNFQFYSKCDRTQSG
jgi:diguanylate cyclase (GGDEF)-like protein